MAATLTSLAAAAGANTDTFNVTSVAGATVGGFCKVDDEYSVILEIVGSTVVVRSRGSNGGVASAHAAGAPVVFGLNSDIPKNASGRTNCETAAPNTAAGYRMRTISADGAVDTSVITEHTEFSITKGSIAAITLNQLPSLAQDGLRLRFVARSNFAHTITNAAGFYGGTASASDIVTLAASGQSVEFEAVAGKWAVVSLGGAAAA
jgi:hypothetical protein